MSKLHHTTVVTPRAAATVLLLRDREPGAGIEVFMLKRTSASKFSPGSYVFPGGAQDPGDHDREYEQICTSMDDRQASRLLGVDRGGLAYWISVVRECFEEAGVLLAVDASGEFINMDSPETHAKFTAYRDALNEQRISLLEICMREKLKLPLGELHYFRRWITPEALPKRYDTRFFITRVPGRQTARHDGVETVRHCWMSPDEALVAHEQGELSLMYPTLKELGFLNRFESIPAVIDEVVNRPDTRVIRPEIKLSENGEMQRIIPSEVSGKS